MKSFLLIFSVVIAFLHPAFAQQDGVIDDLGDIAFIAAVADNSLSSQGFSFMALDEIPAGTQIIFTDEEWDGTMFGSGEGDVTWTNTTGMTLARGTVIDIQAPGDNPTASIGSVAETDSGFSFSQFEHVFAITGSRAAPNFLAYMDVDGNVNNTLSGTGIVLGTYGISFTNNTNIYNGPTSCSTTQTDCLMQIYNTSNYSSALSFPGDVPDLLTGSVLPIELTYFQAQATASGVMLKWGTATETNNAHMAVEHSLDGEKFREIGRVKGAGTTIDPQDYHFLHPNPAAGLHYYRLRQVDQDGTENLHQVVAIQLGDDKAGFTIAPTLVTDKVQVSLSSERSTTALLQLFDTQGRLVQEHQLPAASFAQEIDLSAVPAGMYFVRLRLNGTVWSERIVKQ